MTARRVVHFLIAGGLWGSLAALLGARAFPRSIWSGVVAGPVIGVVVGWALQARFERQSGLRRGLLALTSLYLGGTLFGIALGVGEWRALASSAPNPLAHLEENVLAVWWGITVTGFFLFLWPMAYGTHWLLEWYESK